MAEDKKIIKPKEETEVNINKIIADGFKGIKEEIGKTTKRLDVIDKEIAFIKTGKDDSFKNEVNQADIESAKSGREGVDERIVKIVNETLGEDFGIELNPADGPGMNFVIIVPNRLSLIEESERPIKGKNGAYKKDANDKVMFEKYQPQDRRSRAIATSSNFDAIRSHCHKVSANIVATYTKMKKPLPEFKITKY